MFQRAAGVIQEILGFRTIITRLYDPEYKCFKLMSHGGMKPEMVEKLKCVPEKTLPFFEMMKKKEPVIKPAVKPFKESGYQEDNLHPFNCLGLNRWYNRTANKERPHPN